MTIEEIQTALGEIVAAMVEKGVELPRSDLTIEPDSLRVYIKSGSRTQNPFDGDDYKFFYGTAEKALSDARAYVAALPEPDEIVQNEYLRKVSDAIDYGTKHSIEDKYVTPLRGVTKAMTDNLLTKAGGA